MFASFCGVSTTLLKFYIIITNYYFLKDNVMSF